MLLRELVFQGIFDSHTPVRLDFADGVVACKTPPGMSHRSVQDLVISLLYEPETPHELRMDYAGAETKVALTFDHRGRRYRLLRRSDPKTLRVQVDDGGWKDLAEGDRVQPFLHRSLGLPDFPVFWNLNLWRFEDDPADSTQLDIDAVDPRLRDLIIKYRRAHEAEKVEDRVQSIEQRIAERERDLGGALSLAQKLAKAKVRMREIQIQELSEQDLVLLQEREERLDGFETNVERLAEEEEFERAEVLATLPRPWKTSPLFWGGLSVGLIAVGTSIVLRDSPWRAFALVDIIAFGVCAYALLAYFSGLEKASVHQVRLESIKRRLNQVRDAQVSLQDHLNQLLVHARVDDTQELTDRVAKAARLLIAIEKMESEVAEYRRDPAYVQAHEELTGLRKELEAAQRQAEELTGDAMSAYQLESDLHSLGIEPQSVLEGAAEAAIEEVSSLSRLLLAAKASGQWDGEAIGSKTLKVWRKIAGHVLGDRFLEIGVGPDGLSIGTLGREQIDMWRRTRASEERVILAALAIALQVNAPEASKRGYLETVLVQTPAEFLTSTQAKKFSEVFGSAAKRGNVVLLKNESA